MIEDLEVEEEEDRGRSLETIKLLLWALFVVLATVLVVYCQVKGGTEKQASVRPEPASCNSSFTFVTPLPRDPVLQKWLKRHLLANRSQAQILVFAVGLGVLVGLCLSYLKHVVVDELHKDDSVLVKSSPLVFWMAIGIILISLGCFLVVMSGSDPTCAALSRSKENYVRIPDELTVCSGTETDQELVDKLCKLVGTMIRTDYSYLYQLVEPKSGAKDTHEVFVYYRVDPFKNSFQDNRSLYIANGEPRIHLLYLSAHHLEWVEMKGRKRPFILLSNHPKTSSDDFLTIPIASWQLYTDDVSFKSYTMCLVDDEQVRKNFFEGISNDGRKELLFNLFKDYVKLVSELDAEMQACVVQCAS